MFGIVGHGGVGGTSTRVERGVVHAVTLGRENLQIGGSALDSVVSSVKWMEDSDRFNAGVGSILRIDGETIEMDAVVATSDGVQSAIEAVRNVKNPILLALAISKISHLKMVGEGAQRYARQIGLETHPGPTSRVQKRYESMRRAIEEGRLEAWAPGWTSEALESLWESLEGSPAAPDSFSCDTVGVIALDHSGTFALAASTGGSGLMLVGRVGDVPVRGAGYQIGPLGGVLATGIGEEIIRREGSDRVYQLLEVGLPPQRACEEVVALFPEDTPVGFIALTREAAGVAHNYPMASHHRMGR